MSRATRYAAYRRKVRELTDEHHPYRAGLTRQHSVPVSRGFAWNIPAELIGSPENVSYITLQENLQIGTRLDAKGIDNLRNWGFESRLTIR